MISNNWKIIRDYNIISNVLKFLFLSRRDWRKFVVRFGDFEIKIEFYFFIRENLVKIGFYAWIRISYSHSSDCSGKCKSRVFFDFASFTKIVDHSRVLKINISMEIEIVNRQC